MELGPFDEVAELIDRGARLINGSKTIGDAIREGLERIRGKSPSEAMAIQELMIDMMSQLTQLERLQIEIERRLDDARRIAEKQNRFEETRARYATVVLPGGGVVLRLKPEHVGAEPLHCICPACAENWQQQFLQPAGALLRCPNCAFEYRNEKVGTGAVSVPREGFGRWDGL